MDDIICCATIGVNCIENDPVSVKNGEPRSRIYDEVYWRNTK